MTRSPVQLRLRALVLLSLFVSVVYLISLDDGRMLLRTLIVPEATCCSVSRDWGWSFWWKVLQRLGIGRLHFP
jgi:hypothetical protein